MISLKTLMIVAVIIYLILCVVNFWTLPRGRNATFFVLLFGGILGALVIPATLSLLYPWFGEHFILNHFITSIPYMISGIVACLWGPEPNQKNSGSSTR